MLEEHDEKTRVTEIVKRRTAAKDFLGTKLSKVTSPRNEDHGEEHIYVGGPNSKKQYD